MLSELTVENVAIIDRSQLAFGPGFTALTGETGAGKSLLIDAIGLALGTRADADLVRAGAARAMVALAVDIRANPEAQLIAQELGVAPEDDLLVVHREVTAEGRSTCRIGGRVVTVAMLRRIGTALVDLHGQHDHQALMDPTTHLGFLDAALGHGADPSRHSVRQAWEATEQLRRRRERLRQGRRERDHRLDLLRFQGQEIEAVSPVPGETEALTTELNRLQHAERLSEAIDESRECLASEEGSALERLGEAARRLEAVIRYDSTLIPAVELLRQALYLAEDASTQIRQYAESVEASPERLEEVSARMDALKRLRRKYGEDEEAVLHYLAEIQRELAELDADEEDEAALEARLTESEAALGAACEILTQLRREEAERFQAQVQAQLRDLAMERAIFLVRVEPQEPGAYGADRVEFFFSANAGEPPRALSRIASGGEISRVMLAVKVALAGRAGVPTLIFDEVDTGLSGRAAAVVARKLAELAMHVQVIVISHLPQIAGRAKMHYRIEKVEQAGRTVTQIRPLRGDDRIEEVARMLAGEAIGPTALANARELISESS